MTHTIGNAKDMKAWVDNQVANDMAHTSTAWRDMRRLRDRLVTDVIQQVGNVAVKRELITVLNQGLNELQVQWKEQKYAA